jgi:hypothetical protein
VQTPNILHGICHIELRPFSGHAWSSWGPCRTQYWHWTALSNIRACIAAQLVAQSRQRTAAALACTPCMHRSMHHSQRISTQLLYFRAVRCPIQGTCAINEHMQVTMLNPQNEIVVKEDTGQGKVPSNSSSSGEQCCALLLRPHGTLLPAAHNRSSTVLNTCTLTDNCKLARYPQLRIQPNQRA